MVPTAGVDRRCFSTSPTCLGSSRPSFVSQGWPLSFQLGKNLGLYSQHCVKLRLCSVRRVNSYGGLNCGGFTTKVRKFYNIGPRVPDLFCVSYFHLSPIFAKFRFSDKATQRLWQPIRLTSIKGGFPVPSKKHQKIVDKFAS